MSRTTGWVILAAMLMGMCAPSAEAFVETIYVGGAYVGRYQRAGQLLTAGNAASRKADLTGARAFYEAAIRSEPTFWPAYYTRGWVFLRQRQWNLAIQDANTVLHQDSTVVEAELLRAESDKGLANYAGYLHDLDAVIRLRPRRNFAEALNSRAWFRATWPDASWRNGKQAVQDAKLACKLTNWKKSHIIDTLAAAYAESGDFDSAVRYEEQALAGKTAPATARERQARLSAYKLRRPYRGTE
jgi:tetratricopeptide (TPR) repeat protein